MSEDFHRPTYTAPRDEAHRAYNASQVRLYGVQGINFPAIHKDGTQKPTDDPKHTRVVTAVSDRVALAVIEREATAKPFLDPDRLKRLGQALKQEFKVADSSFVFLKTILRRYMFFLSAIDVTPPGAQLVQGEDGYADPTKDLSSGIIFGYAYEGHCYDLPKPKVMLIPALPEPIPEDDSGYYAKRNKDYRVWIVDKLSVCVEIDVNQGFIEQVVLEANLPGRRSPSMYAAKMTMAHRSGRLTE